MGDVMVKAMATNDELILEALRRLESILVSTLDIDRDVQMLELIMSAAHE